MVLHNDNTKSFWYPLDNAAKIYPAIQTDELTNVYRIAVVLKDRVKIAHLINIIPTLEKRFPYYKVTLKKGFFWYYLEQTNTPVQLIVDKGIPCRTFNQKRNEQLLFRILVIKNRISIEFSHILTDGGGAFRFFQYLLLQYFQQEGIDVRESLKEFAVNPEIPHNEFVDSYQQYFKKEVPPNVKRPKSFHLPYPLKRKPRFDVLVGIIPIDEIRNVAKKKEVNITVYLIALYLYVLQDIHKTLPEYSSYKKNKILRVQVPVNLRNIYSSKTMRNFSLFVMPEIDLRLGNYSFDEILKIVYHKIQLETDQKLINKIIARNVGGERKILVKGIPLFLKSLLLNYKYYSMGANQYSGVVTNLGNVKFPEAIQQKMDYFILTAPPPNRKLKINCGIIGFNDKLVLSFGNITISKEFERKFFNFLVHQGINVKLSKY
ncbi:MAG: hypothetical protein U9P82_10640 [Bacteroidota bacterium]|nr:hypothetical protein [Bacteroidota bacterium]